MRLSQQNSDAPRSGAGGIGKSLFDTVLTSVKRHKQSAAVFPIILLVPLVLLTAFRISGTSIGVYNDYFNGNKIDSDLVAGQPRGIRSDEWLVNTQQTVAQSAAGYPRVNKNIGLGQDMSVSDIPYIEWSAIFRPQNIVFFVLPLEYAFAFKWWFMGYMLIVGGYFFVLSLLPKKKMYAALLSVAFYFSAFVQWWYVHGTLASLYYPLFIIVVAQRMLQAKSLKRKLILGLLLAYLASCFTLVLYPPFQIACGLAMGAFMAGYILQEIFGWSRRDLIRNVAISLGAAALTVAIVAAFLLTRINIVDTIKNTAYPGKRVMQSGEVHPLHLMSSHLGYQFTSPTRTAQYLIDTKSPSNQSETSNFLLLAPFLLIPSIFLIAREYRKSKKILWLAVTTNALFIIFLLEMLLPQFTPLSKFFLLDQVGGFRLLIGMGLLNLMIIAVFSRDLLKSDIRIGQLNTALYSGLVFLAQLAVIVAVISYSPGFIGLPKAVLFSAPIPVVIYMLLNRRMETAALIYLAFSICISATVNPLYVGLDQVTNNPLSKKIRSIGVSSDDRWVTTNLYLENLIALNGEPSLSGTYLYPQVKLWGEVPGAKVEVYNRYAHINFTFTERNTGAPELKLIGADNINVSLGPCNQYLLDNGVGYILSDKPIISACTQELSRHKLKVGNTYVYRLKSF